MKIVQQPFQVVWKSFVEYSNVDIVIEADSATLIASRMTMKTIYNTRGEGEENTQEMVEQEVTLDCSMLSENHLIRAQLQSCLPPGTEATFLPSVSFLFSPAIGMLYVSLSASKRARKREGGVSVRFEVDLPMQSEGREQLVLQTHPVEVCSRPRSMTVLQFDAADRVVQVREWRRNLSQALREGRRPPLKDPDAMYWLSQEARSKQASMYSKSSASSPGSLSVDPDPESF